MEPRPVSIRGDVILLQSLLKLVGEVGNGGEVKALLAEQTVRVNGEIEHRRSRQLRDGDVVTIAGGGYRVVAEGGLSELKRVEIYTDGACRGNPGPGGYGTVLIFGDKRREISGGFRRTTNNRMEIMAVIVGLEALRYPCEVTVTTDSKYVHDAISKGWAKRWRRNGWRRHTGEPVVNPDLWTRLLDLCEGHKVKFEWVKGHAGHAENERCDELSTTAARGAELPVDEGYESPSPFVQRDGP